MKVIKGGPFDELWMALLRKDAADRLQAFDDCEAMSLLSQLPEAH